MNWDVSIRMPQERFLLEDETTLMVVHQNTIVLARALLEFGGMLALVIWLADATDNQAVHTVFGYLLLAVVARTVWLAASWECKVLMLTDKRLCLTSGVLTKKLAVMPLLEITDLTYVRSPGGLLTGYGELILESAGQDQGLNRIPYLSHPDRVYRMVQKAQEDARERRYMKMAGKQVPGKSDVPVWTDLDADAPDYLRGDGVTRS